MNCSCCDQPFKKKVGLKGEDCLLSLKVGHVLLKHFQQISVGSTFTPKKDRFICDTCNLTIKSLEATVKGSGRKIQEDKKARKLCFLKNTVKEATVKGSGRKIQEDKKARKLCFLKNTIFPSPPQNAKETESYFVPWQKNTAFINFEF